MPILPGSRSAPHDEAVVLALGGDLAGDYPSLEALLEAALSSFPRAGMRVLRRSGWWRSAAWPDPSAPAYLNGVAIVETDEGHDRRLWLIVDELDALGAIDGLKDALARLRKFGGRCVLGFQSLAQVSGTYGTWEAQTIVENCANTLILRCSASEHGGTSMFASRLIGEREVCRRSTSRGRDGSGLPGGRAWRRSMNVSEQRVTEAAVLAAELEQLPDLTGYLKTASSSVWLRVRLQREPH